MKIIQNYESGSILQLAIKKKDWLNGLCIVGKVNILFDS